MTTNENFFGVDAIGSRAEQAIELFGLLRERMGWDDETLARLENPDYPPLRDLPEILRALNWAFTQQRKVVVLPDFDMDGISSGVLMYAGLAEMGLDVELYVPDYTRGHDVLPEAIDELVARHPGVEVIVTTDCGVNSHGGLQHARDLGLVVLVTDHHVQLPTEPDGTTVSPANVIIDPVRIDETYPNQGICGAFVAYQVVRAYAHAYAPNKVPAIEMLKLFAGLGTVSDVMPLVYENRQLVRDSLSLARMLRHALPPADTATEYDVDASILMTLLSYEDHHPAFVRAFRGFGYVLQAWREHGSLRGGAEIKEDFFAFYIAPAFNALRRIGAPMQDAFDVFCAQDPDDQLEAARRIVQYNEERKELTEFWLEEMTDRDQPLAPHVWLTKAPAGMLGLLAGRMLEEHQVPVVVVHDTGDPDLPVSGSARAPVWFSIITELTAEGHTAVGHEQACGVHASDMIELAEIAELLARRSDELMAAIMAERAAGVGPFDWDLALGETTGTTTPDAPLPDPDVLLELARRIDTLAPFGHGFPRPRVRLVVNAAHCHMGTLGSEDQHLRITLPGGTKVLWWNAAGKLPDLQAKAQELLTEDMLVEFDVDLSVNRFMGEETAQTIVRSANLYPDPAD